MQPSDARAFTMFGRKTVKHEDESASNRATCLRCRREYTPDPEQVRVEEYCWWCAARVAALVTGVVRD